MNLYSVIGSASATSAMRLVAAMIERRLISGHVHGDKLQPRTIEHLDLTIEGWERYEEERQGKFSGRYGFLALKFNDDEVEWLFKQTIRPGVLREIGYQVINTRDVSRAGIIDNLMRQQIRDSAFVLADLTHDNSGAYWEAGYAEGLGKPVIYLCKQEKFEEKSSHFDTNHCTTVVWSTDQTDRFLAELVATIRRSLNLF